MAMLMTQPSCSPGALAWVPEATLLSLLAYWSFPHVDRGIDGAEVMVGEMAGA